MRQIIGLVGKISSGKGAASLYLKENYNAEIIKFSDFLRDILNTLYLEVNRKNLVLISSALRSYFGEDIIAKAVARKILNLNCDLLVVDGIRRVDDIKYLKNIPEFKLVYIEADPKVRHARLIERNQNTDDKNKTFSEFLKDEELETEKTIDEVAKQSSIIISNNNSLDNLYLQINNLIIN